MAGADSPIIASHPPGGKPAPVRLGDVGGALRRLRAEFPGFDVSWLSLGHRGGAYQAVRRNSLEPGTTVVIGSEADIMRELGNSRG